MRKIFARLPVIVVVLIGLSSCYLPGSFDAEIELSRTGLYKMTFDGYIVDVSLYDKLRKHELDPNTKAGRDRINLVIEDFKRDADTKEVTYYGQGAFHVRWSKGGDAIKTKLITFFRRNENMLSITYEKEKGTLVMRGRYLKKQDRERLEQMGLGMQGVLRVITDGRVTEQNATLVTDKGDRKIYGWKIDNINDPAPKLILSLR